MIKGIIFDIDGVICRGVNPIPGAPETVNKLKKDGYKVIFLSNLSTKSKDQYIGKLKNFGIEVTEDEMVLATTATALYLKKYSKTGKVFVIGAEGLKKEISSHGLTLISDPEQAEFLVAGSPFDEEGYLREENRRCFTEGLRAIKSGAKFVAVNSDPVFPSKDGKLIPGTGAFIGAITFMTKVEPVIVGKPSKVIVDMAIEKMGLTPKETMIVGDQVATDMRAGRNAGIKTTLVLSGVTSKEDYEKLPKEEKELIDYVIDSVNDIYKILNKEG